MEVDEIFYYSEDKKVLFSYNDYSDLNKISEEDAKLSKGIIFYLNSLDPKLSRRSYCVSSPSLLCINKEDINLLNKDNKEYNLPEWVLKKIESREVMGINKNYPNWKESLNINNPKKWRINIVGLGDVGGTLLIGLRLLGGEHISKIGLYGRKGSSTKRWIYELSQVLSPFDYESYPEVLGIKKDGLFDCDVFIFCASKGVPPVGKEDEDVRMIQFKGNSEIIKEYAKLARISGFNGIFSVVSDPVDLLCKVALIESNKDEDGNYDYKGLAPEQIRGYGLGVMNARAIYYAKEDEKSSHYLKEGRAFGPHGEGLIIADSINNYNEEISTYLTGKAKTANLKVRETGYKPYIAPALSSGTLSILATIKGTWHYSATYMGGVYMGSNNRLNTSGVELEQYNLPKPLYLKLKNTHERLGSII